MKLVAPTLALVLSASGLSVLHASAPRMTATGTVVDANGNPTAGMTVGFYCIPTGKTGDDAEVGDSSATGPDGTFVLDGLPAGSCNFSVEAPWGTCVYNVPGRPCFCDVSVEEGVNIHGLRLTAPPEPRPSGSVSGRVVGQDGAPVAHHRVVAACVREGGAPGRTAWSSVTAADGAFALKHLPPGLCRLRVEDCEGASCLPLSAQDRHAPCDPSEACVDVTVVEGHDEAVELRLR
jgi:hypothetical protein